MTRLEIDGDDLLLHVLGWDKLFALKGSLRFPLTSIDRYGPGDIEAGNWPGLRLAGTSLPGFLAGTFVDHGVYSFWDVRDFTQSVVVYLRDSNYEKIVVQVEDVSLALHLIARALP